MYKITFTAQAAKALLKMPRNTALLIREKLNQVAANPFASIPNAKKLQGRAGYRLRVGDWRVIYEINKEEITVIVLKIAPRGEVYK
ncbi:MAG: type II toxin-antitoxin system RelE/ParE family toxin [Anaerolineae bacterium CG_4_9_14_3_um_filter_57_17]|nr:type II toxin-antitoxin system RelE/ParE family toxin [bacterium]NCT21745.1 type II toxin-antitoxin system RelE/ParE family toxin [bacterium]OIO86426.1 MAG: cytotoxin [Anaerolineae bacterium CG2_30_57_67]PJB68382.1 MAG: type II toxin-antitoxin system RelE/ParE family toxin [Anaerolineae bacterium CG_4_9_14_3_um_filter_57_17]